MCLWRVSSENSLVELDFLKALSSQRWIECKICKALWKIAEEREERVKENGCLGGWLSECALKSRNHTELVEVQICCRPFCGLISTSHLCVLHFYHSLGTTSKVTAV